MRFSASQTHSHWWDKSVLSLWGEWERSRERGWKCCFHSRPHWDIKIGEWSSWQITLLEDYTLRRISMCQHEDILWMSLFSSVNVSYLFYKGKMREKGIMKKWMQAERGRTLKDIEKSNEIGIIFLPTFFIINCLFYILLIRNLVSGLFS